jgi:hypothetical protein
MDMVTLESKISFQYGKPALLESKISFQYGKPAFRYSNFLAKHHKFRFFSGGGGHPIYSSPIDLCELREGLVT